jgi:DNA polymerase-3 subunit delta'
LTVAGAAGIDEPVQGFASIVGQDRAVTRLRAALAGGKAHHAYLFEGPEGVGKRTTALALAQAWNCESRPGEGCGACPPCVKIDEGVHPDVVLFGVFNEEGKVKDQSERVRELIAAVGFPPHEGRARVVIVDPAHELNPTAANILLKTLEEPPPGTHFVLCTTASARLLATIRSRCQRVAFSPLPEAVVAERLVAQCGVEPAAAAAAAALCGGSLARALHIAQSEELPHRRERVGKLLQAARGGSASQLVEAAGELSGDREEALATLELLWVTYHDAVTGACGAGASLGPGSEGATLGQAVPVPRLLRGLLAVEEAGDAVRGYVSPQLAVERMLIRLHQAGAW